jgi:hypothetical protein
MADTPTPPAGAPATPRRRRRPAPATPPTPPPPETTTLDQVSLANLTADRAEVTQGAIAHARVKDLLVRQGAVALVESSGQVRLDQSAAAAVVGDQVELGAGSIALLVVAREVHGDVKPLIDWRGALAFGAAFALVRILIGGRGKRQR